MRNYVVRTLKGSEILVTAEQAAGILKQLSDGAKFVEVIGGHFVASHQISEVGPIDPLSEKDLMSTKGITTPPRVSDFLQKPNKKLLN